MSIMLYKSQKADMRDGGSYVQLEEDIVVPYRFGVYDLLVLPPSFPYGGMVRTSRHLRQRLLDLNCTLQENACLTFLTPSM
jgi:leukotriene-A4 hydrolase